MVLSVSKCQAADVPVDGYGQPLGHLHVAQLAAVYAHVRHAVGLHREGLPRVLARAKAHVGEVFVLPTALALVSGKLGVALLRSTDRAAGIEDRANQYLTRRAPVPGRKCRQNDVSNLRLDCGWSIV